MSRPIVLAGHTILIVRDGEHLSPPIAAAITAVRGVSAQNWGAPGAHPAVTA